MTAANGCTASVSSVLPSRMRAPTVVTPGRTSVSGITAVTRWVRASLLANGLVGVRIHARDLSNVLAVLVATKRSIPLSRFADACRVADERARLEVLI